MTLVSLKKTLLLFLCIVTWKLVFSTIGTICNCHSLLPPHVWLILWGFTHTVIIPITLWMNKRNLELSTLNNTRKRAAGLVRTQTNATSNRSQSLSGLLCQEALLFSDPSLSFLLFMLTPCLFLCVTWASCSITKHASCPLNPPTHLHQLL